MKAEPLSIDVIRELISYDQSTGLFTYLARDARWFAKGESRKRAWNTRYAGRPAMQTQHNMGYLYGVLLDRKYLTHRVAFAYVHEMWPEQIDHINGNRRDNRIANLRASDQSDNKKNISMSTRNTTGVVGICWDKSREMWMAHIGLNRKLINLGRFSTLEEAIAARKSAERRFGFSERHGQPLEDYSNV